MNSKNVKICRFCLKTINDTCEIDKMAKEILELLLLKVDLTITESPIMCYECAATLQKAFEFKSACIYTEDCIFPFTNSKNNIKIDLQEAYLKINENKDSCNVKNWQVCRFCMKLVKGDCCSIVDEMVQNATPVRKLLEDYFPEIDLFSVENPVICEYCLNFLELYRSFITTQSNVEAQIKLCIKATVTDGKQVNLSSVQQFLLSLAVGDRRERTDDPGFQTEQPGECVGESKDPEAVSSLELRKSNIQSVDATVNQNGFQHRKIDVENIKSEQDAVKRNIFKCKSCSYRSKKRKLFKIHLLTHKGIWKCDMCKYRSKNERALNLHMVIHKDPSELTMFKCEVCDHESKRKRDLHHHMKIHKNESELPVYNCSLCTYTTNCKRNINKHLPNHRNSSGMYACTNCTYESKSPYSIKKHLVVHGAPVKCEFCSFKARHKEILTRHMRIHTSSLELRLYSCGECTFETYSNGSLKDHKRRCHDPRGITLRLCDICGYKTRNIGHLAQHMLCHKDDSQVTVYKCDLCPHKTKYKSNFAKHVERHKKTTKKGGVEYEMSASTPEDDEDLKIHKVVTQSVLYS